MTRWSGDDAHTRTWWLLADLADDLLPQPVEEEVWSHVATCERCRAAMVTLRTDALLTGIDAPAQEGAPEVRWIGPAALALALAAGLLLAVWARRDVDLVRLGGVGVGVVPTISLSVPSPDGALPVLGDVPAGATLRARTPGRLLVVPEEGPAFAAACAGDVCEIPPQRGLVRLVVLPAGSPLDPTLLDGPRWEDWLAAGSLPARVLRVRWAGPWNGP